MDFINFLRAMFKLRELHIAVLQKHDILRDKYSLQWTKKSI